jgi:hypothetical protein
MTAQQRFLARELAEAIRRSSVSLADALVTGNLAPEAGLLLLEGAILDARREYALAYDEEYSNE